MKVDQTFIDFALVILRHKRVDVFSDALARPATAWAAR